MQSARKTARRWAGVLFLSLALGLLVPGLTVLDGRLRPDVFLLYWLACFAFTVAAFWTALREAADIRREAVREHRRLLEDSFFREEGGKTGKSAGPPATGGEKDSH